MEWRTKTLENDLKEMEGELKKREDERHSYDKKEEKEFKCPRCDKKNIWEGKQGQKIVVECPNCGKKGIIIFREKDNSFKKLRSRKTKIIEKIVGVLLILIGIIFLFNPIPSNMKIGVTSILIGIFVISMILERSVSDSVGNVQVTIFLIAWIIIVFFITDVSDLEIFFILIFIGMLIAKEAAKEFTTVHFKNRMDIFIYVFFIIFIAIMLKKIIYI